MTDSPLSEATFRHIILRDQKRQQDLRNWRGATMLDLVREVQSARSYLEDTVERFKAGEITQLEATFMSHEANCIYGAIMREFKRRESINQTVVLNPDRDIIRAVKEANKVEDVLEMFNVHILYSSKTQMKFRCELHGSDTTPSGVIYTQEQRWHCFGCNQGGDCIDAAIIYGRLTSGEAIRRLATRGGIELRPLTQKKSPQVTGGIEL